MTPLNRAITELKLIVDLAEHRATDLKTQLATTKPSMHQAELHDHRAAVSGDMADALDRLVEAGLGARWMQAMYPELKLAEVEVLVPA